MYKPLILVPFSSPLSDGCDYALQTIKQLSHSNRVIGIALHEPYTWKQMVSDLLNRRQTLFHPYGSAHIFRPLFLIPGQRNQNILKLNLTITAWLVRGVARFLLSTNRNILWFFEPYQTLPFLETLSNWESIYDCVDYFSDLNNQVALNETQIWKRVDVAVVNSQTLLQLHAGKHPRIQRVPLGFPLELFPSHVSHRRHKPHQKKIVGFVGGINYRLDFKLLNQVIAALPEITFRFVGPIQSDSPKVSKKIMLLQRYPNTEWLPPVPKADIASIVSEFDIAIIPYDLRQPLNRYCYPMKLMEYFYLEKPVISTPLAELKYIADLSLTAATTAEWIEVIRRTLSETQNSTTKIKQRKFAVQNSWQHKIEVISHIMDLPRPTG